MECPERAGISLKCQASASWSILRKRKVPVDNSRIQTSLSHLPLELHCTDTCMYMYG